MHKYVPAYVAQVSDTAQVTRQEYVVLNYAHICSINCLSFTTSGYNYYIRTVRMYICTYKTVHTYVYVYSERLLKDTFNRGHPT